MDLEPPPAKRRRTTPEPDYSSQPQARERDRGDDRDRSRRHYSSSQSRSRDRTRNDDRDRRLSYRHRSPSVDYTPRSRSHSRRRSYTHTISRSQSPDHLRPPRPVLSFTELFVLPSAHARGITSAKFSPDHTLLATASADASINIYSVPSQLTPSQPFKLLRTLRAHLAGVNAISWSPIGPPYTLASASDDKSILLWSPLSSDFPIPPSPLVGHSNYVYSLAFSPKGNMLVSGSYDEAVFLWDVRSAKIMRQLPAHSDPVSGVDFIRDGTMVCSCASDGLIRIWDAGTGQCLKTLVDENRKAVTAVRFSPNGKFVLAWTLDNCIRLWKYMGADGACVKTYQGHVNNKYSLAGTFGEYNVVDEDGVEKREAFVVSGSEDGDILLWDVNSKEVLWRGVGHKDVVLSVDYGRAKDGKGLLVSVGKDRQLRLWVEDAEPSRDTNNDVNSKDMDVDNEVDIDGRTVKMEIKREDTMSIVGHA
ncbi:WD domain protein [Neophaeococcomyces mojaviensis]|uniref:WD domain protein n=1 Tax=Neophaeococcomyces mojaviensis TaxID=3383035 RepID=A0ACC3A8X9_9EURO|nr:WD domain protein [Knufia sp. JES_112]